MAKHQIGTGTDPNLTNPNLGNVILPVQRHVVTHASLISVSLLAICVVLFIYPTYSVTYGGLHFTEANTFLMTMASYALSFMIIFAAIRVAKYKGSSISNMTVSLSELQSMKINSDLVFVGSYVIKLSKGKQLFGIKNIEVFLDGRQLAYANSGPA